MTDKQDKYPDSPRNLDFKSICLDSRFGDLKFEAALPQLKKMQSVLVELEDLDYKSNLTQQEINQIDSAKNQLNNFATQIQGFKLSVPNPQQQRDQIQNEINQFYQNTFSTQTRTSLIFLRQETKPTRETEKELQKALTNAKNLEEKLQKEFTKIQTEKEKVSRGEASIGTQILSKDFQEQYSIHEKQAEKTWFKRMIYFYVALFIFVIIDFFIYALKIRALEDDFKIEFGVFSLIMVATIFYGLNFCSRNFNIQKNLAITNRNKRNVAETFQRFLESEIDDTETKNKFLEEASKSMFENKSTGYLSKDQMQVSTPVQEMVTKIISSKV